MTEAQNKLIEEALNSESFTSKIEEAAPYRVKIMTDYSKEMKDIKNEFISQMAETDPKISIIHKKSSKERSPEEKEAYKKWMASQNKRFGSVKGIIHPNMKANGELADPIGAIVAKVVDTVKILSYIGRDDLVQRFAMSGINISFKPLEDEIPDLNNEDERTLMKDIFSRADECQGKICEASDKIKIDIFNEIDPQFRYSKEDPVNKSGIKPAQFQKLVKTKAVGMTTTSEKYTEIKKKEIENSTAALVGAEIVLEKTKML